MVTFRHVLYPTDLSEASVAAFPYAAVIAKWFSILALDACYQQAPTPYVVITGQSGFGIANVLTGTAPSAEDAEVARAWRAAGGSMLTVVDAVRSRDVSAAARR